MVDEKIRVLFDVGKLRIRYSKYRSSLAGKWTRMTIERMISIRAENGLQTKQLVTNCPRVKQPSKIQRDFTR